MTAPRRNTPARQLASSLSTRPAIQRNCRRCHDPLPSGFGYCWSCSLYLAGIRWHRLFARLLLLALGAGAFFILRH